MFGRYELLERINIGGMAETIKARDTGAPGRPIVAVKRVLPHLVEDAQYLTMFGDEARTLARLAHDNVIRTLDVGSAEGIPYIALEYVHGQDARLLLHRARRDGAKIPLRIACFLVAQTARGLHFAHELCDEHGTSLGLVHRDVSLQNILVSYEGDVKLIDFGIARATDNVDHTDAGIVKGKFGYMSPEQVKGEPLDRRSDVFSLGICLWELVTGERMFPGKTTPELLRRVRDAEIEPPRAMDPDIPAALDAIVMRALRKDPRDRFETADDLRRALLGFMNETGNECGAAELASHVRRVFAPELRKQPSPDVLVSEVARKFDEESGLSAFDDVDPVSAVSTLEAQAIAFESESERPEPIERPRRLHAPPGRPSVPPMRPRRASVPPPFAGGGDPPRGRIATPAPRERIATPLPMAAAPALVEPDLPTLAEPVAPAAPGFEHAPASVEAALAGSAASEVAPPEVAPPAPVAVGVGARARGSLVLAAGAATAVVALGVAAFYLGGAPEPATLQLVTRPADVVVTVDGARLVEDRSPFVITDLEPDVKHEIVVAKLGHREWSVSLALRPGQVLALPEVTLPPLAQGDATPIAGVTERSPFAAPDPSGVPAGVRGPDGDVPPPTGREPPRSAAQRVQAPRAPAASASHGAATSPAASSPTSEGAAREGGSGVLRINTRPWSEIYVDGAHVGNTPQMNLALPAGSHVVRLVNPEFDLSKTIRVEIGPGETVTRVLALE